MLRPRFFTHQALAEGASLTLEAEPSRHIAKALRMRANDRLCLFCGDGCEAVAVITAIDRHGVSVRIEALREVDRESPLRVTLAISLSRGDRMDTIVQKATELGVAEIWPLISGRTGVRLDASRLERKQQHWRKIAISACEQCGRNQLPGIRAPASLDDVLRRSRNAADLRLILHPGFDGEPAQPRMPTTAGSLLLLVGPEGGFGDAEVGTAREAGFDTLRLGPRVLRTETAPLAAIAVAQARWGDFSEFG
ncbi:MAG: 16S rRNA (uracil(1498)-N(3))-methyltransferase [Pseudomonadota bacterium]